MHPSVVGCMIQSMSQRPPEYYGNVKPETLSFNVKPISYYELLNNSVGHNFTDDIKLQYDIMALTPPRITYGDGIYWKEFYLYMHVDKSHYFDDLMFIEDTNINLGETATLESEEPTDVGITPNINVVPSATQITVKTFSEVFK